MNNSKYIKFAVLPLVGLITAAVIYVRANTNDTVASNVSSSLLNPSAQIQTGSENTIDHNAAAPIYFSIFKFITNLAPKH